MDEAIAAWAKSLDAKTEATLEKVKRKREKEVSSPLRELSTIEDCMEVLEGMEDVDDTAYLKALEKFTSSDWRRMMDSNEVDNNGSSSESDSSSDLDDSLGELLLVTRLYDHYSRLNKEPCMTSHFSGRQYVIELLNGHPHRLFDIVRMDKNTFRNLCSTLKELNFLQDDRSVCVEEAVCMFLFTISHTIRNRVIAETFQHSKETVSRQFNRVLKAICRLGTRIIQPPNMDTTPSEILGNPKYDPWFQNCIGAIDGTHISAWAPSSKQISYRGTANDSRVLMDAITREENRFPMPQEGKYYVVDSGYANMSGFLAPYRKVRYHLRDFRGRGKRPRGAMELFNFRHSSLRNVVERCIGVLKNRFPILKLMPNYPIRKQRRIPVACCAVHNFIRMQSRNDTLFQQFEDNDVDVVDEESSGANQEGENMHLNDDNVMNDVRDHIARSMWLDYVNNN
ncbi:hypothetical protein PS2_032196 [Malus domestica]